MMKAVWSVFSIVNGLYLAADFAMIGETDDEDGQMPKIVRERENGQRVTPCPFLLSFATGIVRKNNKSEPISNRK